MAQSTLYDIRLRYQMEDRATRPMRAMAAQVDRTAKSSRLLAGTWGKVGAAATAYFGVRAGYKALIGFNANMEQAKIQMAGMVSLTTKSGWQDSIKQSSDLVGQLQERAKLSVGTTKDMVSMASMIVRPIMQAGLSMKDLENLTAGSVVAARAFGIEAGMAARDIESVLMGRVRSVDRFARSLLEPMGMIGEEGRRQFNEMSAQQRAMYLKSALTSTAIMNMAKAQEQSFSGVYSTFQDNLQIFLGKVGLPLFKNMTAEIRSWNVWIDANADRVEEMGKSLASGLSSVFGLLRDVAAFFVNHADTLLTVAKGFAVYKLATLGGGLVGQAGAFGGRMTRRAGAGLLAGNMTKAGMGVAKFGVGIASAAGAAANFAPHVALAGFALKEIHTWWTKEKRAKEAKKRAKVAEEIEERKEISFREAAAGKGGYRSEVAEMEELREKRLELRPTVGAKDPKVMREKQAAYDKRYREENLQAVGREIELTSKLGAEANKIRQTYKQLATYLKEGRITGKMLTEGTSMKWLGGAAAGAAARRGLEREGFFAGRLASEFAQLTFELSQSQDATGDFTRMLTGQYLPAALEAAMGERLGEKRAAGPELPSIKGAAGTPKINVTIHRIEAKSEDPDRFVFDLARTFEDVARTGSYRGGPG